MRKFRSAEDEARYIEGQLSADESRRAIAWEAKQAELQSALDADLIDGFDMEPIDFGSDDIAFTYKSKPQLQRF